jgi:hypothetical protein
MATGRVPTTANSPLTAKGDLFGYSTTQARVAVGNDGETLVADSSTSTGLRWQGNYAAGKNKIINGDFGVWQRGTTFNAIVSNTYFADRWTTGFVGGTGGQTTNITRQTFTPGTAPVAGYEGTYFARVNRSVSGDDIYFGQRIEDVRTFAGQTVTVSFWAKVSSGTLTPSRVFLNQNFGSGGSSEVDSIGLFTPTFTTSWQRFTQTISVPSIAGKTIGTNSYLWGPIFQFASALGTFTLDIWGFQLEAGNTATAFQTATGTIQGELAACQRYYYRVIGDGSNAYQNLGPNGNASSTGACQFPILLPVIMRKIPSAVDYAGLGITLAGTTTYAVSALSAAEAATTSVLLVATTASTLTQYRPYFLSLNANAAGYFGISAEL